MKSVGLIERQNEYGVQVRNNSTAPIYDVRWELPLIVHLPYFPPGKDIVPEVRVALDAVFKDDPNISITGGELLVLDPGRTMELRVKMEYLKESTHQPPMPFNTYSRVSFVDDDGYRMGWVYRRTARDAPITDPQSVRGVWEIVEESYPDGTDDVVQCFHGRIPKPAPAPSDDATQDGN